MFTKESFDVIRVTDIPRKSLSKALLHRLLGCEIMVDVDRGIDERLYSGDIFQQIAGEFAELSDESRISMRITDEVIAEADNLAEIIETELVRVI